MIPSAENDEVLRLPGEDQSARVAMPRETLFGSGSLDHVGEAAAELGGRAFLAVGPESMVSNETLERVSKELLNHAVNPIVFRLAEPQPDIVTVDCAAEKCTEAECDVVVGLGEAGIIDAARFVSILCGSGADSIRPFLAGERSIETRTLPLIAIPAISVTGAEVSGTAFIIDKQDRVIWRLSDRHIVPETVIIDPGLTLQASPAATAVAGISAFAHALEAFVSLKSNQLTDTLALDAVRLVGQNLVSAVRRGTDKDAKTGLCLAAYLAGAAASGAGLGVANLLAHPLGMMLESSYGEALAIVLPSTIKFNQDHVCDKYGRVADLLATETRRGTQQLSDLLASIYDDIGIHDIILQYRMNYGTIEETLSSLEKSGARAETNPRPLDRAGLVRILRRAREYVHSRRLSRAPKAT